MSVGLVVEKCGMSRIFTEDGASLPVTILKANEVRVTQLKTLEKDGYHGLQLTCGAQKQSRVSKPAIGHYKKANVEPGRGLWEFRVDAAADLEKFNLGDVLKVEDIFEVGQKVNVRGVSKGKGFAGVVKRHNFSMQDATHGNSLSHRAPGSIGQNQSPGKVFKGKKMAGQMGNKNVTVKNQEVVQLDAEKGLLFVKGAVPGAIGTYAIVCPTVKAKASGGK